MPSKPTLIYRLTPAQIALVDRLAAGDGIAMHTLAYPELTAYEELEKLGFAEMRVERRKKIKVVITALGTHVRAAGYISKQPVVRLTQPQIAALRLLAGRRHHFNDIPAYMKESCRRLRLRGWAATEVDDDGHFWTTLTADGRALLELLDS